MPITMVRAELVGQCFLLSFVLWTEDPSPLLQWLRTLKMTHPVTMRTRHYLGRGKACDPDPLIPNMDNGSMVRSCKRQRDASEVPATESSREAKCHLLSYLPEEPQEDKGLNIYRVCVRFPDGQRVQRRNYFGLSVALKFKKKLFWSFYCSQVQEATEGRPFRLAYIVPGSSQPLNYYHKSLSFGDAGFSNFLISMIWDEM